MNEVVKQFKHEGETWELVGENKDGFSCICTNGKEKGAYRFTHDELRRILENQS